MQMEGSEFASLLRGTSAENLSLAEAREQARHIIDSTRTQDEEWARFMLAPDKFPPVRMPSLFPIATHLYRKVIVNTITASSTGTTHCLWQPEEYRGQGRFLVSPSPTDLVLNDNIDPANVVGSNFYDSDTYGFSAHAGVRLIGAVCEIDYMGTIDDTKGLIEVGMHLNSHRNATGGIEVYLDAHFASSAEINQMPYYQKFHCSEGVRTIWFPVDQSRFNFMPHATGDAVQNLNNADTEYPFTQDPVRLEWAINIVSSGAQDFRVKITYYYEGIVDEGKHDIYLPQKPQFSGDPDNAMRSIHKVLNAQNGMVTSSRAKEGMFSTISSQLLKWAPTLASYGLQAYGMYSGNPIAYGMGSATKQLSQYAYNPEKSYRI